MSTLIEIKNLSVGFHSQGRPNNVVHSISFNIPKGKTVAIVGESGSGKTVTAMSILKLLPYPSAFHESGEIIFNNYNGKHYRIVTHHDISSDDIENVIDVFNKLLS